MDAKKSNKISEIVRLQQILKKWKKNTSKTSNSNNNGGSGNNKGIKFLKKTLSFSDNSVSGTEHVPKGYLAVCVGKELKRYVIPTEYLGHQAFGFLLREAEEEFGFHQVGLLKIPCDVVVFEMVLKMVEEKREKVFLHELHPHAGDNFDVSNNNSNLSGCCSPDYDQVLQSSHPQLCR